MKRGKRMYDVTSHQQFKFYAGVRSLSATNNGSPSIIPANKVRTTKTYPSAINSGDSNSNNSVDITTGIVSPKIARRDSFRDFERDKGRIIITITNRNSCAESGVIIQKSADMGFPPRIYNQSSITISGVMIRTKYRLSRKDGERSSPFSIRIVNPDTEI